MRVTGKPILAWIKPILAKFWSTELSSVRSLVSNGRGCLVITTDVRARQTGQSR